MENTLALEKQLRFTQLLQVITLIFLFILSTAVIYLLMLQICGEAGCFGQENVDSNDEYSACSKNQRKQ